MRRRIHPTYIAAALLGLAVLLGAGVLIRQPYAAQWSSAASTATSTAATSPTAAIPAMLPPTPTATAVPPTPTLPPTATPTPPTFAAGSRVAGVDVGGRTVAQATALVDETLAAWRLPLPLVADAAAPVPDAPALDLAALGVVPDVPRLMAQAAAQIGSGAPVDVRWQPQADGQRLRESIQALVPPAPAASAPPPTFTPGNPPQVTFRSHARQTLDVEGTAAVVEQILRDPSAPFTRTAVFRTEHAPRPLSELEAALRQQMESWNGVAGIAVRDLQTGETLGINDGTVFSGASVMKVPIMVYAYAKLGAPNDEQRAWLDQMILNSNNTAANNLLAAGAGGRGLDAAARGALETTAMLHGLGLQHTHMLVPYEGGDLLAARGMLPQRRPAQEGTAPYTKAGGFIRATPGEMAQFFAALHQCGDGGGPLLDYWKGSLTKEACGDMLRLLRQPHDTERMMAGIPDEIPVAHKGGWITNMQADVGIVYSPDRTYVAAIYLWRDGAVSDGNLSPSPYLGAFSHTIYSFYNPE